MDYQIFYHPKVKDDMKAFPKNIKERVQTAIEKRLMVDPVYYGDPLRKSLKGFCKLRVGDYRIIYKIEKETVMILKVGHRKEVYENVLSRQ